ncbi:hypothetical protein [Reyranella sp.]|uniref:hypothetical protein n=1 Tax=Reyranella sp. TaxID=1929291 RepID=UPI00273189B7|nr:hypothetical protein [Reyranella sp.]MDP2377801.1 hypothetical protein [Reyranella sp.]
MNINKEQLYVVLKGLMVAGGPVAILLSKVLGLDDATVAGVIEAAGALISILGLVWLGTGSSDKNLVLGAKDVRGVQVHVDKETAPAPVVSVAEDDKIADVVTMNGGPRAG